MNYSGKRVTILGLGREGMALAKFMAKRRAKVTVSDIKDESQLASAVSGLAGLPIDYALGGHPPEILETDVVFVSPGVPREIPILAEAVRRGVELSSETSLFFDLCPAPIIGITGSSGKTTTTSLVGEIMLAQGRRTYVGGNIGAPLIDFVERIRAEDAVVLELSSFQLENLKQSPHVAAVLNLSPNHLDRHASMDDYVTAKKSILQYQDEEDFAVLNADQEPTRRLAELCAGSVLFFSRSGRVESGAFLDQGHIIVGGEGRERRVCHISEVQLRGPHNQENVLAACATAVAAGADAEAMRAAVTSFRGVEHRIQLVGQVNGVEYFDDSIATSPDRTMAALNSFSEPIVLLAGGREKHLPLRPLATLILEKVKALILFGEAAPLLEDAVLQAQSETSDRAMSLLHSASMSEAVALAAEVAEPGDVVLLSPACTSFDMYTDFAERGDHFASLVQEMRPPSTSSPTARGDDA
jgi:UDP-N-acetylmuramoylalanine--D-glutamate ligase